MNAFDYTIKLQKIQQAKTQKAIKAILIPLVDEASKDEICPGWGRGINYLHRTEDKFQLIKMYYHIFKVGVDNYPGTGLQDYLLSSLRNLEDSLIARLKEGSMEYEEFMETFKYSASISLETDKPRWVNIINTVGTRELPCKLRVGFYVSRQKSSIFANNPANASLGSTGALLELEELKREYAQEDLTILNLLRDKYYKKNLRELPEASYDSHSKVIDLLLVDLDTVIQETERRLNEQANTVHDPLPEAV